MNIKGQCHLERKCKNRFSRISSPNVDRFTSNESRNDQRPILHTYRRIHFISESVSFFV